MVRQLVKLSATNTHQSVNLEFDAEILSVINPTAQSIGVSVGGNISPDSIQTADIWIPAMSGLNYPIVGRNFAVAYMLPSLVNAPTGIPTSANLFFTAHENVPNFGAFPLSTLATQALADVGLIPLQRIAVSTFFQITVPVTPDIQSVTLILSLPLNVTLETIIGSQTGVYYYEADSGAFGRPSYRADVQLFGLDQSIVVTVQTSSAGYVDVLMLGHRYVITQAIYPSISGLNQSIANPSWLHAPDVSTQAFVAAPAAGATICTLTIAAAGLYRIAADFGTTDGAAANKYCSLIVAGNLVAAQPAPGSRAVTVTAVAVAAGQTVSVQNGNVAGTAGVYWFGSIAVYKI
jgi:hypothetical protein